MRFYQSAGVRDVDVLMPDSHLIAAGTVNTFLLVKSVSSVRLAFVGVLVPSTPETPVLQSPS